MTAETELEIRNKEKINELNWRTWCWNRRFETGAELSSLGTVLLSIPTLTFK